MAFCLFIRNDVLPDAEETEGEIEIFPDYKEVAVPCNIAPLNFKLKEHCEAIALFSGKDLQIRVDSDNGSFQIPEKKWRRLLDASAGGKLTVGIYIRKENRWLRYPPFSIQVVEDKIDSYLVYRRIAPGYRMWNRMGIYQRCLEDFTEETFLDNKLTNNNCMNCHSFCMQNPDRMHFPPTCATRRDLPSEGRSYREAGYEDRTDYFRFGLSHLAPVRAICRILDE